VEEILRHGTELGVSLFVPVISGRSNRKPHEKKDRWNTIVESASAQCGRIAVPTVEAPVSFDEFLQRDFTSDTSLLLSNGTHAEPFLKIFGQRAPDRVTILVGPEGGFDEDEESGALSAGFLPVSLCRNILRTETAALVAVGAVVTWHNSFVQEKSYEVAQTETKAPVQEMDQFDKDVRLT
jgi:16S rRNA (uracil1498-N3)-methyltransferase